MDYIWSVYSCCKSNLTLYLGPGRAEYVCLFWKYSRLEIRLQCWSWLSPVFFFLFHVHMALLQTCFSLDLVVKANPLNNSFSFSSRAKEKMPPELSPLLDVCRILPFLGNFRCILECSEVPWKGEHKEYDKSICEGSLNGRKMMVIKECSSENKRAFM